MTHCKFDLNGQLPLVRQFDELVISLRDLSLSSSLHPTWVGTFRSSPLLHLGCHNSPGPSELITLSLIMSLFIH